MSGTTRERLYNLLPSVYRVRDVAQGEPLRALLRVIERELELVEDDIDQLYDNWFVETCDEWIVPYLGDLLGVRGLLPIEDGAFSQRGFVANTLAYRRGKGTAAVLEQLARDITGWPARVAEFFELLAATQFINHIRPTKGGTVDLRDTNQLELVHGPFERAAHTVDVRHIDNGRGRYNIPNVGIFLWRLGSYHVTRSTARAVADPPDGRFTFNPLGASLPLFNRPRTEAEISQLAAEEHVPDRLRRRPLFDDLEALRQALTNARTPRARYFGSQPVLEVFIRKTGDETFVEIPPEKIFICDLRDTATGDWRRPPETKPYIRAADGATIDQPIDVAVDPVLGRLAFRADYTDFPEATVEVNYAYGFSGDLGGGPYNRRSSVRSWLDPLNHPPTLQIGVTQDRELLDAPANTGQFVETVAAAIAAWHDYLNENPDVHEPFGLIAVMDSRSYDQPLPEIQIPANGKLVIASADWPELDDPDTPGQKRRIPGQIVAEDRRAHLASDVTVLGTAGFASVDAGELVLDGLLIEGAVTVVAGNLGRLLIAHCTLVPDKGGLSVVAGNPRLTISLDRSMSGEITVPNLVPRLSIIDSIVDGTGGSAIVAHGCGGDIQTSTLFGEVALSSLEAGNSIFTGRVTAIRRQIGCVRFCFLPFDSLTPRRYLCQPAEAASEARVFPRFTSVTFGEPGYGQLRLPGQPEITAGAEDEGELGAFHFLQTVKRLRNLQTNLDDYLRFGLEAGVLFGN